MDAELARQGLIAEWNDHPDRSQAEVLELFDSARLPAISWITYAARFAAAARRAL